ncbi:MAG: AbrB/MazE/SpoVT family DNA-binding domain-containing protein [Oscillospiraceae bacterium]|jgi:transcriptional pleiotropic regulator of transition state genes|nr:AbrB/MazE/SpoVT family DNA-binding domain-containing protein [Oscillospiraceae bacterium]
MKSGYIRRVDKLGRIVIPLEVRKSLYIDEHDSLEVFVEDGSVVLKKYSTKCIFCFSENEVFMFKDRYICKKCLNEIKS